MVFTGDHRTKASHQASAQPAGRPVGADSLGRAHANLITASNRDHVPDAPDVPDVPDFADRSYGIERGKIIFAGPAAKPRSKAALAKLSDGSP
jgi:hypothetical protein